MRALGAVVLADLLEEFAVGREFQDLVAVVVAAEPDVAVAVDVDAVLVLEPGVARARRRPRTRAGCRRDRTSAPAARDLQQLRLGRSLSARPSRRRAACAGRWMIQTLSLPSTAMPATWPRIQFVGQGLRPERINGELGRLGVGLRGDVGTGENEYGSQGCKQQAVHGRSPRYWPSRKCRVGLLWCKPTPKFRMGRIVEYAVAWGTGMPEMHARPRYRRRSGASSRAIDIATLDRRWRWGHVSRRWTS